MGRPTIDAGLIARIGPGEELVPKPGDDEQAYQQDHDCREPIAEIVFVISSRHGRKVSESLENSKIRLTDFAKSR